MASLGSPTRRNQWYRPDSIWGNKSVILFDSRARQTGSVACLAAATPQPISPIWQCWCTRLVGPLATSRVDGGVSPGVRAGIESPSCTPRTRVSSVFAVFETVLSVVVPRGSGAPYECDMTVRFATRYLLMQGRFAYTVSRQTVLSTAQTHTATFC